MILQDMVIDQILKFILEQPKIFGITWMLKQIEITFAKNCKKKLNDYYSVC